MSGHASPAGARRGAPAPPLLVVSGCSGGGKSTLVEAMAARGHRVAPEPGRVIVQEALRLGGDCVPWRNPEQFAELCVKRGIALYEEAEASGERVLFDRSLVDAVTALERLRGSLAGSFATLLERYRYAARVFMAPPWPELFAVDAERRHGFDAALEEFDALMESYPRHGYEVVVLPKTSVAERVDFLERRLPDRAGS